MKMVMLFSISVSEPFFLTNNSPFINNFSAYMIHASTVNETSKIRLSTDLRFVNPDSDFE